jgi:hypothetical protein
MTLNEWIDKQVRAEKGFNPGEPRDASGRWSITSGRHDVSTRVRESNAQMAARTASKPKDNPWKVGDKVRTDYGGNIGTVISKPNDVGYLKVRLDSGDVWKVHHTELSPSGSGGIFTPQKLSEDAEKLTSTAKTRSQHYSAADAHQIAADAHRAAADKIYASDKTQDEKNRLAGPHESAATHHAQTVTFHKEKVNNAKPFGSGDNKPLPREERIRSLVGTSKPAGPGKKPNVGDVSKFGVIDWSGNALHIARQGSIYRVIRHTDGKEMSRHTSFDSALSYAQSLDPKK